MTLEATLDNGESFFFRNLAILSGGWTQPHGQHTYGEE